MESKEIIQTIRKELSKLSESGHSEVSVSSLTNFLSLLETNTKYSEQYLKMEHESKLANYAHESQSSFEMFNSVMEASKSALNSIIVINGGAVIALMGIMSNLVDKPNGLLLTKQLSTSLLFFGSGVLAGCLGFAFRYTGQELYSDIESKFMKIGGHISKFLAIAAGATGICLFALGILNSYKAFSFGFV